MSDDTSEILVISHPLFMVSLDLNGLDCELRVNDVPVLRLPGGKARPVFDVNPQVFTGLNSLELRIRPPSGSDHLPKGATCTASLRRRILSEGSEAEFIAELSYIGPTPTPDTSFVARTWDPGAAKLEAERLDGGTGLRGRVTFPMVTPYPPWPWLKAQHLVADDKTLASLFPVLRQVWKLLDRRDIPALEDLCALQVADLKNAYYLADLETAKKKLGMAPLLTDPDAQLAPLETKGLQLELLGDGRLARVVDGEGSSPLAFTFKGIPNMRAQFIFIFAKLGGQWRVVR